MRWPARLHHGVRGLFQARAVDSDMDEELQFHLRQLASSYVTRGWTAAEAERQARRDFGGFEQLREACRDMRNSRPLEDILRDLRFGGRLLLRNPAFTIVAVLSLMLGIGGTTAIFTLLNAIALKQLPVERPGELYVAETRMGDTINPRFSFPLFERIRNNVAGQAEAAAASRTALMRLAVVRSGAAETSDVGGVQLVSGEYFTVFRQQAQIGRLLTPQDNKTLGGHPVTVISDGYWMRRFGRSPQALGASLSINDALFTIVGVAAPDFFGNSIDDRPDAWVPLQMQPVVRYAQNMQNIDGKEHEAWPPQSRISWLAVFLRVPDGQHVKPVQDRVHAAFTQVWGEDREFVADADGRETLARTQVILSPGNQGTSRVRGRLMAPLLVLLGMMVLLLAITCANVASLLLARGTVRQREMAIRLSIGAGRWRLVRQLLAESLLLVSLGGLLGLGASVWGTKLLFNALGDPSGSSVDVSMDWRVFVCSLALTVGAGLVFGLLPALRSTRVPVSETLKSQARGVIGATSRLPGGKLLVMGQMALCLFLLIIAGLFTRSLQRLSEAPTGFDRDHVVAVQFDTQGSGYKPADLRELHRALTDRVAAVPGVKSVSLSANGPLSGSQTSSRITPDGYTVAPGEVVIAMDEAVVPTFFDTVGLRLVAGRLFTPDDQKARPAPAVINEAAAKRYFGSRNPISLRIGYGSTIDADAFQIIGVVSNARTRDIRQDAIPTMYRAAQEDEYLEGLEVRTTGGRDAVATALRGAIGEAAPKLRIISIESLDQRIRRATGNERMLAYLTSTFSGLAVLLACIGLYGTISYAVARRTGELGVRVALGASRTDVLWLVMREAMLIVLVGVAIGAPLAILAANGMAGMLFGVKAADIVSHGGAILTLGVVAALAAYLPARRAARVDAMRALRAD